MFNPLAFSSTAALDSAAAETCGCACSGCVGVAVDDLIVVVSVDGGCGAF